LGALTDEQAEQIRHILRIGGTSSPVLCRLDEVIPIASLEYLDLAVAEALWEEHGLSHAFGKRKTTSVVSTPLVAKVLTINRCVCPCSHYAIEEWLRHTALPQMLGFDPKQFNDDKLYYELDKIYACKRDVEDHLFSYTYGHTPEAYELVNYDLSTSYFVGVRCSLARFGRSKDGRYDHKQVVLGMLINNDGLPFHWDVWPGNTAEITTLEQVVHTCRERFHLQGITMVFDRGIVSDDNLLLLESKALKYISALDRDQIAQIPGIPLERFEDLDPKRIDQQVAQWKVFQRYDDGQVFQDLGTIDGRRYILGFNVSLFLRERHARKDKVRTFEAFLATLNEELAHAQRSRKPEPTRRKVEKELRRLKLSRVYHPPELEEMRIPRKPNLHNENVECAPPKGIRTYRVRIEPDYDKIQADSLLDGLCVWVTNHTETSPDEAYLLPAHSVIWAYRNKIHIEDAFKHVKSFLKIRPFFVHTQEHVVAVYTLCVVAYFLNQVLANRRQQTEGKNYLNTKTLYSPFNPCKLITLSALNRTQEVKKLVARTPQQQQLLNNLGLTYLEDPPWLRDDPK
jgi:transposase